MQKAQLLLETGETFNGYTPGWQETPVVGEVVFNTGMVGYVESMTDPSYIGQILTFTYPLIGNYGVAFREAWESSKVQVAGVVTSQVSASFYRTNSQYAFLEWCEAERVPVMMGVDTRALTKVLRTKGVINGHILPEISNEKEVVYPDFETKDWVSAVTTDQVIEVGEHGPRVIVVDCGMKENIWRHLKRLPVRLKRVPYDYDYTKEAYDGVFLSNGPGNPACYTTTMTILRRAMETAKPIFGICLGSQLMGLACGATTYKLRFGHRSQNQPCLLEGTDRCYLTSQNHGYAIDEASLPSDWTVYFRNLNDHTVQGIRHKHLPFFSVQFHPEACPGPVDTAWLFDDFYRLMCEEGAS